MSIDDEWIKNMCCIHIMESYSDKKEWSPDMCYMDELWRQAKWKKSSQEATQTKQISVWKWWCVKSWEWLLMGWKKWEWKH